jgi:hypothetical protein
MRTRFGGLILLVCAALACDGDVEPGHELPLSAVTGMAVSPYGTIVGGVSEEPDRFWDAWLIPLHGERPRRLAPIGDNLVAVDADGALWTTIVSEDDAGHAGYEVRLSPADGAPSRLLSPELPSAFSLDRAVADGDGGRLLVGSELRDGASRLSVFAVDADGSARRVASDPGPGSALVVSAELAPDALQIQILSAPDGPPTTVTVPLLER